MITIIRGKFISPIPGWLKITKVWLLAVALFILLFYTKYVNFFVTWISWPFQRHLISTFRWSSHSNTNQASTCENAKYRIPRYNSTLFVVSTTPQMFLTRHKIENTRMSLGSDSPSTGWFCEVFVDVSVLVVATGIVILGSSSSRGRSGECTGLESSSKRQNQLQFLVGPQSTCLVDGQSRRVVQQKTTVLNRHIGHFKLTTKNPWQLFVVNDVLFWCHISAGQIHVSSLFVYNILKYRQRVCFCVFILWWKYALNTIYIQTPAFQNHIRGKFCCTRKIHKKIEWIKFWMQMWNAKVD